MLKFRFACSVGLEENVTIFGGYDSKNTVSVYNSNGWVEDLANLSTGRYHHACGYFTDSSGQMVYYITGLENMSFFRNIIHRQPESISVCRLPLSARKPSNAKN